MTRLPYQMGMADGHGQPVFTESACLCAVCSRSLAAPKPSRT